MLDGAGDGGDGRLGRCAALLRGFEFVLAVAHSLADGSYGKCLRDLVNAVADLQKRSYHDTGATWARRGGGRELRLLLREARAARLLLEWAADVPPAAGPRQPPPAPPRRS